MVCYGVSLLYSIGACGQDLVYLVHSETLSYDEKRLKDAQILKGEVCFRHDSALMYCDSAYFYEETNSLDAFGHVRFVQGDTLKGYGDMMFYDGNRKLARLRRHVRMEHYLTILTTDSLNYDRVADLAWYYSGGQIQDTVSTLTSGRGYYTPATHQAVFRDSVHLTTRDMVLDADTLNYNTQSHVADLVSQTHIVYNDETTIDSDNGWHNTSTEQSMLKRGSWIHHYADNRHMTGDALFYNKRTGYAWGRGHVQMHDSAQHMSLYGHHAEAWEDQERGYMTDSALVIEYSNDTSRTYMHADTIYTEPVSYVYCQLLPRDSIWVDSVLQAQAPDTILIDTTYRQVRAFHNVRSYNREYQLTCDSVVWNGRDSVATLYHNPLAWNDRQQVSADTIRVYVRNEEVDYIHGIDNALLVKHEARAMFDQMSGKEIKAFVRDGDVYRVDVQGNAETVFYPREDDGTFTGVNRTQSSYVTVFMHEQKVDRVLFTTATSGTLFPIGQATETDTHLSMFFWAQQERPISPDDIWRKAEPTPRPKAQAVSAAEDDAEEQTTQHTHHEQRNKRKKE